MANQVNRLSRVLGKGSYLRLLFREIASSASGPATTGTLIVLPAAGFQYTFEPNSVLMSEAKFGGDYFAPTTASHMIQVDLRRRSDPVSIDALGIMTSYFDAVVLEIGDSERCHVFRGMTRGPYSLGGMATSHMREMFSLRGGCRLEANVELPAWARTTGTIPATAGYTRTGVAIPAGF